jgi:hypothetical protein
MTTPRFSTLLVLPATLWLAASLVRADENCSITRPGGVKEPGVTNIKGECCSSFYSNSGNWDDCVPPTPDRPMAPNSILQCQNTEARNREGAQLHRRCS